MVITMTNPGNGRRWRLRPYSNGLCYVIEKSPLGKVNSKNGKEIKSEFVSCDKYPMTIEIGIETMLQMALRDPEDEEQMDIEPIMDTPQEIAKRIKKKLDEIVIEIGE